MCNVNSSEKQDPDKPGEENSNNLNEEVTDDDDESLEIQALDNTLDALHSALDVMETKWEHLHSQLVELLESNRKISKEIKKNSN